MVTAASELPPAAKRDLLVAQIAIKYTQSNSVGYAKDGQMVGVGAGQQSRVDCVKLAGRKVETWYLRQHPKVLGMRFNPDVKRQERINARVRYIEGDMSPVEMKQWATQFVTVPEPLTQAEKAEFMATLTGVSLASDAFFPFRDSLDVAASKGVSYVVAAGGSVADAEVIAAADEYAEITIDLVPRRVLLMTAGTFRVGTRWRWPSPASASSTTERHAADLKTDLRADGTRGREWTRLGRRGAVVGRGRG